MLDSDQGTPEEVASALRSISTVNRWFGGNRLHRLLLGRAARGRTRLEVLEVAAGFAEPLATAAQALGQRGVRVETTLLDLNPSHFPRDWPRNLPPPRLLSGNALAIPLPAKSVDVVSCSLFLHHLAPEDALRFLREGLRVARVAVVVNDLRRTRTHYALALLRAPFDPSRLSRHDGPVSVRQAHSFREVRAMLQATGRPFTLRKHFLYRFGAYLDAF